MTTHDDRQDETGGGMSDDDAARRLAGMHLRLVKQSEAVHRKRKLKPSERAMWLADLRADRLALAHAYRALTGRDLTTG